MPLRCPLYEDRDCDECRLMTNELCWWFFPARPLTEVLTLDERCARLEKSPIKHTWNENQWEVVRHLRGMVDHLQNNVIGLRKQYKDIQTTRSDNKGIKPEGIVEL